MIGPSPLSNCAISVGDGAIDQISYRLEVVVGGRPLDLRMCLKEIVRFRFGTFWMPTMIVGERDGV